MAGRPGLLGAVCGASLFACALASVAVLNRTARGVLLGQVRAEMCANARREAESIDAGLHAQVRTASDDGSAAYERVVAPLRNLMRSAPEVRFAYTFRHGPDGIRFAVDATPHGDADHDGIEDHSFPGQPYSAPDPALWEAVNGRTTAVSPEPYTDAWGTHFSAYAPVFRRDGSIECWVGIDIDAGTFASHVGKMGRAALAGIGVAAVLSAAIGIAVAALRRRQLASQREAERSRLQLVALAANVPGAVYTWCERPDGKSSMPYASPGITAILGVAPGEVREDGDAAFRHVLPDDLQPMLASIRESRDALTLWEHQFRVRDPDGTVRWVEARSSPQREPDGTVTWQGYCDDVTARKESELALRRAIEDATAADRAKGEFIANVSHEIRTPMTAIIGYAEILRDGSDDGTIGRAEAADAIARNAEHLLGLLNDVLDMARIEAGGMKVRGERVDVAALAREVVALFQVRATARGIALRAEIDPGIDAMLTSDPVRIRQVLGNLVGNAIKFTPQGTVTVRVEGDAANVCVAVRDTGPGMTDAQQERLFQPFAQLDSGANRATGGTGLGLAISRRIARILGGDVRVSSTPGTGSEFTLWLPRTTHAPQESNHARCEGAARGDRPLLGARILLAEDGQDNARLIAFHLERAGAVVKHVTDGRAALAAIRAARIVGEGRFDLVILDMQMPVMDGYEAAATIRREGYPAPILALTAHAAAEDEARCLAAGCDGYASKPISRAALLAACLARLSASGWQRPADTLRNGAVVKALEQR